MPYGPEAFVKISQRRTGEVIENIDRHLKLKSENSDYVEQEGGRRFVDVIIADSGLTIAERNYVAQQYTNAGWHDVLSTTSLENNERGGLIRWRFYFKHDMPL